jgi:hypothetical protein
MSHSKPVHTTSVIIKFLLAILLLVGLFAARSSSWLAWTKPLGINPDNFCLFDTSHHLFQSANLIVNERKNLAYPLILMSSLMIDGVFIYTMMIFVLESDTARLIYCVFMFYGMRGLLQVVFADSGHVLVQDPARDVLAFAGDSVADGAVRRDERLLLQRPHGLHDSDNAGAVDHRSEQVLRGVLRGVHGVHRGDPPHLPRALLDR